ncbi:MAG TPA: hypothetical protein PKO15_01500 [Fibrobacteria bacterium]|nr:hypothetical protein [Fibrobacteria bacterium]
MRKILLVALALASFPQAGAFKATLAIAPALVRGGDLPTDLIPPFQKAVAEILSWEASLIPGLKVVDPANLDGLLESRGWSQRSDLNDAEVEEARSAGRELDATASLAVRIQHLGPSVDWKVALAYRAGTVDRTIKMSGRSREDELLLDIRTRTLQCMDSLGLSVPASARQMVATRGKVPWEALMEYATGIRDQAASRPDDALRHLREAQRKAPFLPALQVRLKTLERENPGK